MQKIIGAILIILASGGIGVTKGLELQKYLRELELLKQLFWMLKREIQYTKAPFSEAFSHIGRRMEGAQGEWLLYLAKQIEEKAGATFFELWTESIDRCLIKSQLKNKDKALKVLRSRLYDMELQKRHDAEAEARRSQVGTGDRSEKIRTYNFPQGRVTDHRIKLTLHRLDSILNGDLQEIIDRLISADQMAKLANQGMDA